MLDPSLPWLATGYRNFKEKDFCRPHSANDSAHYRFLETGSNHRELRPTTPSQHQHRRVKSATYGRVHSSTPTVKHRLSSRPRSARSTENFRNERVGCYNYSPETIRALARRPKSASAVLLRQHRPSSAQNKSVTQVERFHHTQEQLIRHYEKVTGEEVQHSCAFCPVQCRPTSSSSNRPTSSTGLLAAHLPSHHDRRYNWTRPKTAPTTKREISSLPRHNNVRRGRVPYYTNFVSKLPLHLRDRTPSPPAPRRRRAFQEEAPPPVDVEDEEEVEEGEDEFLEEDLNIEEDDIAEPVMEAPSPTPPPVMVEEEPKMEPPTEVMEAWTPEIKAPTPTPAVSRRNSRQEPPVIEKAPSPIPSPPASPIPPPPPEKASSPPPTKSPTPPPPKSPTPPPKSPTPPPQPPQELSIKPPRECVHKPKPAVPALPKVKKEVRIQEPQKAPPKDKVIVKKEKTPIPVAKKSPTEEPPAPVPLRPSLKKTPSEPKIEEVTPPIKMEPPPLPSLEPEPMVEPTPEPSPNEMTKVEEEKAPEQKDSSPPEDTAAEKKKLGPPPTKIKVDMFGMDPQSIKQLLDLQMRAKRRGGNLSDDEDEKPPPGLASLLEPTNRMLKQGEWLRGRIALSRRAARFELPMDVGELAEMTPVDYLRQHCIISQRRRALYKKAFLRVDKDNDGKINRKELEKAVLDALVDTIQPDKVAVVLGYLGAEDDTVFNSRFFSSFCALLERLYYREFTKDDVGEKKDTKEKEILEEADFSGLDWKLQGQYVNPPLKSLLYML